MGCGSVTREDLKRRQAFPLDVKVRLTQERIREWHDHYDGAVYVSYSGGKDSTVLLDLVKGMYPGVPAVFCDTGLEYPEVRELALRNADVVLRPEKTFKQVVEEYGYPVGKRQARMVRDLQNETASNSNSCNLHRTGRTRDGKYCPTYKLAERWLPLADAPFKVSEQCCDALKKRPFHLYEKETGRRPMNATMAAESSLREKAYMQHGCNAFHAKKPMSSPMAFWTEQDVLGYVRDRGLEIAGCYGEVVEGDGGLSLTGEQRTGCMFCMFGVHLEGEPNRFQRMQRDYPRQWDYCIRKLGVGGVLDYLGVPYACQPTLFDGGEAAG